MRTRTLGATDLRIPIVCFGAFAIGGGVWGAQDEEEAVRAIRLAVDLGMNAFDTAPVYGLGRSEEILGRALSGMRDRAVIMTKVGMRWDDPRPGPTREMIGPDGRVARVRRNARPESVRQEVEASLRRLGVEHLDLVQVHAPDPETPIAETMGALADLRRAGKLREIGISNYDVAGIDAARKALAPVPLASDQPGYSLLQRGIEKDILPYAIRHDVGILVHTALEQGLLTGRVGPERTFTPVEGRNKRASFQPKNRERVNALLRAVVEPVAREHGVTIGQTVLAWTAAQPGVTAVLVGARSREQVRENAGAGDLELSQPEIDSIGRAFAELRLEQPAAGLRARVVGKLKRLLGRK